MPKPTSAAEYALPPNPSHEQPVMRVVMVTMDSHIIGAADRARVQMQHLMPGIEFSIHAASQWGQDPKKLELCIAAIRSAHIVIATMLFMEEHYEALLPVLRERREHCDAMVCIMSASPVSQLTRMGQLDMSRQPTGLMGLLRKLRPKVAGNAAGNTSGRAAGHPRDKSSKPSAHNGIDSGQRQMKMLRTLPKLLRFIPGTAQDLRAYFLVLQYWLAGSQANMTSLVQLLVQRYAQGPRKSLRAVGPPGDPIQYPDQGLYHPGLKLASSQTKGADPRFSVPASSADDIRSYGIVTDKDDLPRVARSGRNGRVGILLLRSYLLAGNTDHYDGVITALEAQGLQVLPVFAAGLDARPAIESYFFNNGQVQIDCLVSLTGFSLVGGPAYNDAKAAERMLAKLDVPYLNVAPVEFQTLEQWEKSERGLLPVESTMMVAIPELDGATGPSVFGGRTGEAQDGQDMRSHSERAFALASRIRKLVDLRASSRAERKIAIVLFNFPPNAGNTGTAAFLSVFQSLFNTLARMKAEGYQVDLPANAEALRKQIVEGNAQQFGAPANVLHRIQVDDYVRRQPWLKDIEAQWGPAPGKHWTDGQSIWILGAQFGNVVVGIQPGMGFEGDPMRLLFAKGSTPTHAFNAFYRYLRFEFGAHALLHFGTHGALEFMPGKQVGLSSECWPDRLIGDTPNIYLYAANNPSEGTIAKRRAYATLVSYLTPSITEAGLYKGLSELKTSIERFRQLQPDQTVESDQLLQLIQTQAQSVELMQADSLQLTTASTAEAEQAVQALAEKVLELEYTLIPHGLHVVGQPPSPEEQMDMLIAIAQSSFGQERLPSVQAAIAALIAEKGVRAAADYLLYPVGEQVPDWLVELDRIRKLLLEDHEMQGLLRALDGRFIAPAPGADVMRNPDVLPTGRNLHGFDPFKIPSAFAIQDGERQVKRLLSRHQSDGNKLPESVALVLWGTDNLKSEGAPIGQALALLGARPRFDSYGRLAGAQLIPLEELGRPRIDVVLTLSGIFRDLLPLQIKLLAEAAYLAATADEPEELNFVRKHSQQMQREQHCDVETAALRVFGNAEGAYGANVNLLIDCAGWEEGDELASTYAQRKGFAYGRHGKASQQLQVLDAVLSKVELAYQNLESVELGVTTIDTYFDTLGGVSKAIQQAKKSKGLGATPVPVYISDQTQSQIGHGVIRTLSEQVALETRTRTLNPKWFEALLAHGYEGVRQIEQHVTNTMGWSATTGQVQPWVYQQITETFMLDPAMRERLAALNPSASARVAQRLIEASQRAFWQPDDKTLAALQRAGEELEDRLEGIPPPPMRAAGT